MKTSNRKRVITSIAAVAIVLGIGVPMSSLLVAGSQPVDQTIEVVEATEVASEDGVSALMAADAVGRARGCSFGLRRPASAFVP
ncbi:MAG: hypothetical protein KDB27_24460 [Planctomycetales bacterium]|nr:hypothetical protein [Planctomycetales bacterium]